MMKRFFLLLVFIGLSVAVLSAQDNKSYTISGSVLDKSMEQAIPEFRHFNIAESEVRNVI